MNQATIEIKQQRDIITARQTGRDMARQLGFRMADQTRLATAISELTRNALQYAGGGVCIISDISNRSHYQILLEVIDKGPGIPDVEKAMTYGYTTGNGLGAGLPGAKSLVHSIEIESEPGKTRIIARMQRRRK